MANARTNDERKVMPSGINLLFNPGWEEELARATGVSVEDLRRAQAEAEARSQATVPPLTQSVYESPQRRALFVRLGIDGAPARPSSTILTEADATALLAMPLATLRTEFSRRYCALPPAGFASAAERTLWISQHQWCATPAPFAPKTWIKGVPNLVTAGVAVAVVGTGAYMFMKSPRSNPSRRRRGRR